MSKLAHDADSLWTELVKTALLGTERQSPQVAAGSDALGRLLVGIPSDDPASALLSAASLLGVYRTAGRLSSRTVHGLPKQATVDDRVQAGRESSAHLSTMLAGQHQAVLMEWLAAAAATRHRAPDETLPGLLDLGRAQAKFRPAILAVLGERGRWLASQNPDWDYVGRGGAEDDSVWETGFRAARLAFLEELRRSNPGRARELLVSTWPKEPAEDRAQFLNALSIGLSLEDEPWLELVLDDKSKLVRRLAALLLTRLPDSALARRMAERARALVQWKAGKSAGIEVKLPREVDPSAERDGIDPTSRKEGFGEKANWVHQILGVVPPGVLVEGWGKSPEEILRAVETSEWRLLIMQSFLVALKHHPDARWAEAMWHVEADRDPADAAERLQVLLSAIPELRRATLVLERLCSAPTSGPAAELVITLLQAYDSPWNLEIARAAVGRVRDVMGSADGQMQWRLRALLPEFARRVPPAMLAELSEGWPLGDQNRTYWKGPIDQFLALLQFRRDMLKALEADR